LFTATLCADVVLQASGVEVDEACKNSFIDLKLGHKYRYIIYSLTDDMKQIVVLKTAQPCKLNYSSLYFTTCNGRPQTSVIVFNNYGTALINNIITMTTTMMIINSHHNVYGAVIMASRCESSPGSLPVALREAQSAGV